MNICYKVLFLFFTWGWGLISYLNFVLTLFPSKFYSTAIIYMEHFLTFLAVSGEIYLVYILHILT